MTNQLTFKTHHSSKVYLKNQVIFKHLAGLRVVAKFGDSITTDHISPAGAIGKDTPAGKYLRENGVEVRDFNSYGSRRGNHEVMMRGTFANIRIRNQIAPGTEGGYTTYWPTGEIMAIYDACDEIPRSRYWFSSTWLEKITGWVHLVTGQLKAQTF